MAAHLVAWLQAGDWDVYQEVSLGYACARADVVAVRAGLSWVVECKMALSFEVVAQARRWRQYARVASVCVPAPRGGRDAGRDFALRVCEAEGVGVVTYRAPDLWCGVGEGDRFRVDVAPRPNRGKLLERLVDSLQPEHKTALAAGSQGGGYWTPWQRTCREILAAVTARPGIPLRDLILGLDHHYASDASARGSILKWAEAGKVRGVRVARRGRAVLLFPA